RMNAFWASENFDAFITSAPVPSREFNAENSSYERSSFWGSEHADCWLDQGYSFSSLQLSGSPGAAKNDVPME
ncbi:hypothetical protein KX729_27800, partial [Rhizobium sp. XQZ8]|nr:hypothetical protein [Rhizobium populisoli]